MLRNADEAYPLHCRALSYFALYFAIVVKAFYDILVLGTWSGTIQTRVTTCRAHEFLFMQFPNETNDELKRPLGSTRVTRIAIPEGKAGDANTFTPCRQKAPLASPPV